MMKMTGAFAKMLVACFSFLLVPAAFAFAPKPFHNTLQPATVSIAHPRYRSSHLFAGDSGPATLDKPTETVEKTTEGTEQSAKTRMPAFELRLWNDPFNKREFVARCLAEVCGKSDTESFQIMMQAHKNGMGVVGRYDFEIAELYLQSLQENGLLVDIVPVDNE